MCVTIRKLTFVPEGPNDRSQAIYCLEQVRLKIRPVGHGLILTHGWLVVLIVARLSDPSHRPYGTKFGRTCFRSEFKRVLGKLSSFEAVRPTKRVLLRLLLPGSNRPKRT
jgi:hypothetical protein